MELFVVIKNYDQTETLDDQPAAMLVTRSLAHAGQYELDLRREIMEEVIGNDEPRMVSGNTDPNEENWADFMAEYDEDRPPWPVISRYDPIVPEALLSDIIGLDETLDRAKIERAAIYLHNFMFAAILKHAVDKRGPFTQKQQDDYDAVKYGIKVLRALAGVEPDSED